MIHGFVSRHRLFDASIRNVFAKTFRGIMDAYNNRSRIFLYTGNDDFRVAERFIVRRLRIQRIERSENYHTEK